MDISEGTAKYLYRAVIAICITTLIAISIFVLDNRYHSNRYQTGTTTKRVFMIDTWTGKSWHFTPYDKKAIKERE